MVFTIDQTMIIILSQKSQQKEFKGEFYFLGKNSIFSVPITKEV